MLCSLSGCNESPAIVSTWNREYAGSNPATLTESIQDEGDNFVIGTPIRYFGILSLEIWGVADGSHASLAPKPWEFDSPTLHHNWDAMIAATVVNCYDAMEDVSPLQGFKSLDPHDLRLSS